MRILVVEDEDGIRSALVRALTQAGWTANGADTLAAARAAAAAAPPQVLVSDLKLPDGSGLDLARELGVPFVMLSGFATFDDAVAALRLGAADFLTKPAPIRDLKRALARIAAGAAGDGAAVVDPAGPRLVSARGAVSAPACAAIAWSDPAAGIAAYDDLLPLCPGAEAPCVAAELIQSAPSGRLVVNRWDGRWSAWLDAPSPSPSADAKALLGRLAACAWTPQGAVAALPLPAGASASAPGWWFPRPLADGVAIDLAGAAGAGAWLVAWLRAHPGTPVIGAGDALRRVWADLGLEIAHRAAAGVTPAERSALFG